jgi:N-methylhydantoinase A
LVSTERGRDARDYVLVPFGGAGPLHAARVAAELGIRTIVVPPNAGVLSAYGLLASDFSRYETLTRRVLLEEAGAAARVREIFSGLKGQAVDAFADLGIGEGIRFSYSLEMRFVGQAFEITVSLPEEILPDLDEAGILSRFNDAHTRVFAFGESGLHRAEIVSFRLGAAVPTRGIPALSDGGGGGAADAARTTVFDQGEWRDCALLTRASFSAGESIAGPALIEDGTSTIYIPEGWRGSVDRGDNIVIETEE